MGGRLAGRLLGSSAKQESETQATNNSKKNEQGEYTREIIVYCSSATGAREVKWNQQNLNFLLQKKKCTNVQVLDMAQMEKDERDKIYQQANANTLPLVFINSQFVGDYDTLQKLDEEGRFDEILT